MINDSKHLHLSAVILDRVLHQANAVKIIDDNYRLKEWVNLY